MDLRLLIKKNFITRQRNFLKEFSFSEKLNKYFFVYVVNY